MKGNRRFACCPWQPLGTKEARSRKVRRLAADRAGWRGPQRSLRGHGLERPLTGEADEVALLICALGVPAWTALTVQALVVVFLI